jgi:hypothetical protein
VRRAYGDALRAAFAALDRPVVIGWPLDHAEEKAGRWN